MATHRAQAVWEGDLESGVGRVDLESGAAPTMNVSWLHRTEGGVGGQTSPEELIAAAHGSCFAMALSHGLTQAGHPPQRLSVAASCAIEQAAGGWAITKAQLKVRGVVPGIDDDAFLEQARGAAEGCPVSSALSDDVDVSVEAELAAE
jgi:lipoyl-dependent peroxiredoxin